MNHVRREIRSLGPWSDTLLWYARGVAALQALPVTAKTSWRFLAAMHDYHEGMWRRLGRIADGEALPPPAVTDRYWQQCQHGTWYFFPWHRAYLLGFEAIVRDAIVALDGPADWALPYWNYSDTAIADARKVPREFLDPSLPDGSPNALHVAERYGRQVRKAWVDQSGLTDSDFTGAYNAVDPGMGGPETQFSLDGDLPGLIELTPHGGVHVDVGAASAAGPGLMRDPRTAALDPIFWLHHANIDRLWEVWLRRDGANANPAEDAWREGPADREFAIVGSDGQDIACRPKDMEDLSALGYSYDDLRDPFPGQRRGVVRLRSLRDNGVIAVPPGGSIAMAPPSSARTELIGSSSGPLKLGPQAATARVDVDAGARQGIARSFARPESAAAAAPLTEPDRVFLRLEHIRGSGGSGALEVFVRPRDSAEERSAGVVSLFGLEAASEPDGRHGGAGLTRVLEITPIVDELRAGGADLPGALDVRIDSPGQYEPGQGLTIEQVSIYRVQAP